MQAPVNPLSCPQEQKDKALRLRTPHTVAEKPDRAKLETPSLVSNFHSDGGAMQAGGRNKASMDAPSCEPCGLQNETNKQAVPSCSQITQLLWGKQTAP